MKNIAVVVAGGSSTRCGFDKLFTDKFGKPVIEQTLSIFEKSEKIDGIVLVLSEKNLAKGYDLQKQFSKVEKVLLGGRERCYSVKNAIDYLQDNDEKMRVIVHSGANHRLKLYDLEKGIELADEKKNVVFGYFSPNSIKKVVDGEVVEFLDRDEIFETQTPQISDLETFGKAFDFIDSRSPLRETTIRDCNAKTRLIDSLPRDEAELLDLIDEKIFVYECCPSNTKMTYASDFK